MIKITNSACFVAFLSMFSAVTAAQPDNETEFTVVIGNLTPLYHQCFDNASNGRSSFDALAPCNESLEKERLNDRKIAIAHANRGVIHYNIGAYEEAVSDFTEALDRNIHVRAKLLANRGMAYEALSADSLARADYAAALAINPKYAVAKKRFEELSKPIYERSRIPRRITAEAPGGAGI